MRLAERELFLKYALPCGQVLVKRGKITQEELDKQFKIDPAVFKVGLFMCEQAAKSLGKSEIDAEAIRQYFWLDHDEAVREHPDIDAELCMVYPGEYLGKNTVRLPIGERKVNITNTPSLKQGDCATVHYQYTCEKITREEFEKLWELKK